jgi:hypothetical protein
LRIGHWKHFEAERGRADYELEHARNETLSILALVAEYRDDATSEHIEGVGEIARVAIVLSRAQQPAPQSSLI